MPSMMGARSRRAAFFTSWTSAGSAAVRGVVSISVKEVSVMTGSESGSAMVMGGSGAGSEAGSGAGAGLLAGTTGSDNGAGSDSGGIGIPFRLGVLMPGAVRLGAGAAGMDGPGMMGSDMGVGICGAEIAAGLRGAGLAPLVIGTGAATGSAKTGSEFVLFVMSSIAFCKSLSTVGFMCMPTLNDI